MSAINLKIERAGKSYELLMDRDDYYRFVMGKRVYIDPKGYPGVTTRNGPKRLHKLVMPDCPPGRVVHHRDGNKLNNRRSNLELSTSSRNNLLRPAASYCRGRTGLRAIYRQGGSWRTRTGRGPHDFMNSTCLKDVLWMRCLYLARKGMKSDQLLKFALRPPQKG